MKIGMAARIISKCILARRRSVLLFPPPIGSRGRVSLLSHLSQNDVPNWPVRDSFASMLPPHKDKFIDKTRGC